MHTVACSFCALSVALIFYTYRAYRDHLFRRDRTLRERITYMLWTAANQSL
jgi:hypothetical protein